MNNSTDKTVLVTGGADGIGLGLASKFGKEGCKIMIVDINQEQANIAKSKAVSFFEDENLNFMPVADTIFLYGQLYFLQSFWMLILFLGKW